LVRSSITLKARVTRSISQRSLETALEVRAFTRERIDVHDGFPSDMFDNGNALQ
jgi:hypothetical protein